MYFCMWILCASFRGLSLFEELYFFQGSFLLRAYVTIQFMLYTSIKQFILLTV